VKIRDRIQRAGPLWNAMFTRLDELIKGHNELVKIVLQGKNTHETNDATNVISAGNAIDLDSLIDLGQDLITKYEAHIANTTVHVGADSTNVVTELGVAVEIYTLLNEMKVDYEAHRVLTAGSVHAGADATNVISADNATTKATAILLANDLRTQFIANFANVTTHHGADGSGDAPTSDALLSTASWTLIASMADELRASYEAHRVNVTGSIHGGADSTNTVTATAIGTILTAALAGPNELKGDFNAHILETGSYHVHSDISMLEENADGTTLATGMVLVNSLKVNYTDHISYAEENVAGPIVDTLDME
jgi:hypothetical protein